MKTRKDSKKSFEYRMEELERMIEELSRGGLSLEESMKLYEQGVALSAELEKQLAEHRKRLEMVDPETGEILPMEVDRDGLQETV